MNYESKEINMVLKSMHEGIISPFDDKHESTGLSEPSKNPVIIRGVSPPPKWIA
jgi:hypothetical protein